MGAFMAEQGIEPELILCSPAVRTRQTLDLVLPLSRRHADRRLRRGLLPGGGLTAAGPRAQGGGQRRHIMIVGHDPGMHGLAVDLAGAGTPEQMQALAAKFPTAGLAVLDFEVDDWSRLDPGSANSASS